MGIFSANSEISWESHLIRSSVRDLNVSVRESGTALRYALEDSTRQIVASNEALQRAYSEKFDAMSESLSEGFGQVSESLDDISNGIRGMDQKLEELSFTFSHGLAMVSQQLEYQTKLLTEVANRLDTIHGLLNSPTRTQARELFQMGCERLRKGLYDKALEALHRSEQLDDTSPVLQYIIGHTYLYAASEDCCVVDPAKAEHHLRQAVRFAKAELAAAPEVNPLLELATYHAAVACWILWCDAVRSGRTADAAKFAKSSAEFARRAFDLRPNHVDTQYQFAKASAIIQDSESVRKTLELLFERNRDFCLLVDLDPDFALVRDQVYGAICSLRKKVELETRADIERLKCLAGEPAADDATANAQLAIVRLISDVHAMLERETYFDALDAHANCKAAQARWSRAHPAGRIDWKTSTTDYRFSQDFVWSAQTTEASTVLRKIGMASTAQTFPASFYGWSPDGSVLLLSVNDPGKAGFRMVGLRVDARESQPQFAWTFDPRSIGFKLGKAVRFVNDESNTKAVVAVVAGPTGKVASFVLLDVAMGHVIAVLELPCTADLKADPIATYDGTYLAVLVKGRDFDYHYICWNVRSKSVVWKVSIFGEPKLNASCLVHYDKGIKIFWHDPEVHARLSSIPRAPRDYSHRSSCVSANGTLHVVLGCALDSEHKSGPLKLWVFDFLHPGANFNCELPCDESAHMNRTHPISIDESQNLLVVGVQRQICVYRIRPGTFLWSLKIEDYPDQVAIFPDETVVAQRSGKGLDVIRPALQFDV
jgi:tetratricopeptide (TPR) repeat protein